MRGPIMTFPSSSFIDYEDTALDKNKQAHPINICSQIGQIR